MQEYITDKEGKHRKATWVVCDNCKHWFLKASRLLKSKHNYCCRKCRDEGNSDILTLICATCITVFQRSRSKLRNSKSGLYFCCRKCKDKAQRLEGIPEIHPSHYSYGLYAYREKALEFYGEACEICGYSEYRESLHVHHIDRNRRNNAIENLIVLCANHHVLVTYGVADLVGREFVYLGAVAQFGRATPLHGEG